MKPINLNSLRAIIMITAIGSSAAQPAFSTSVGAPSVIERGPHHARWAYTTQVVEPDGTAQLYTHSYVQLQTGLHHLGASGDWELSGSQIEVFPVGAVYRQGQFQVIFPVDITDADAVELKLPEGQLLDNSSSQVLKTRIMGLAYYDPVSADSVLIAELKSSIAELLPSKSQLIYRDALTDFRADIQYSISPSSFEQDVILREQPPSPSEFGLSEDSELMVLTESMGTIAPAENAGSALAQANFAATNRIAAATPLVRNHLSFGAMSIDQGRAFSVGEEANSVTVSPSWKGLDSRNFIIESVPLRMLQPLLQNLPRAAKGEARAAIRDLHEYVQTHRPSQAGRTAMSGERKVRVASSAVPARGLILDYNLVLTPTNSMVFQSDTTYLVTGPCILSGVTTIEGNAVVKFANTNNPSLRLQGTVSCQTGFYSPAIFTAKDDDSVGESITGSSGNPSGYYAATALIIADNTSDLRNIRICRAAKAIQYEAASGWPHSLMHAQILNCGQGIVSLSPSFWVRNALFCNVLTNFTTSTTGITGNCEHITVDTADKLNGSANLTLNLTNSLLVSVTNYGSYSGAGNATAGSGAGVFQSAGAGAHYLADGSNLRNAGAAISYPLQADFYSFTTYPPSVFSNATIFTDTVWGPQIKRDTDAPDCGYHYPALDFLLTDSQLPDGATLLLTNGVAVAFGGTQGLTVRSGCKFTSEGQPQQLNRLVRHLAVQEPAAVWGSSGSSFVMLPISGSMPEIRIRFTEVSLLADTASKRRLVNLAGGNPPLRLALTDCQLRSMFLDARGPLSSVAIALTNNLIQRGSLAFTQYVPSGYQPFGLDAYNNLFLYGSASFTNSDATTTWTAKDNLFDNTSVISAGIYSVTAGYNGYRNATSLGGTGNKTLTAADYAAGPLGNFYYPAIGVNGGLTNLFHAGSRSATNSGLFHYTTRIDQTKEGTNFVDIGYHSVAVTPGEVEMAKSLMNATASSSFNGTWTPDKAIDRSIIDPGWINASYTENPGYLRIDLTNAMTIGRVAYIPRVMTTNGLVDGTRNGAYRDYEIYVTNDGTGTVANWGAAVATGRWMWPNLQERKDVSFTPKSGRYVYFRRVTAYGWYSFEDPNYWQFGYPAYAGANEIWLYLRNSPVSAPLDADGDGLADYFEDRNGNGTSSGAADGGETNWQGYDSQNGLSPSQNLQVYTPLK